MYLWIDHIAGRHQHKNKRRARELPVDVESDQIGEDILTLHLSEGVMCRTSTTDDIDYLFRICSEQFSDDDQEFVFSISQLYPFIIWKIYTIVTISTTEMDGLNAHLTVLLRLIIIMVNYCEHTVYCFIKRHCR